MAFRLFKRRAEVATPPATTNSETLTPQVDDVLLTALLKGSTITRDMALTLPAVAGAVDYISGSVASMPIKLYKRTPEGKVEEVLDDPRTTLLNTDTRDTLDGYQFKKAITEDYLLDKGGYAYIQKSGNYFTGLYYVKPQNISIITNTDPIYKDYSILVIDKKFQPHDFIKVLRNTQDGASGVGLTAQVSTALETAYETLKYQLNLVKSGGNKKGFIKSSKRLTQESLDALKKAWRNLYGNNEENVVVLNDGLEFQEASNTSVEMQLNENKKTLYDEINNIFHIYPDDYDKTFKLAIFPILKAFETALNRDFLLESEKGTYYYEFDVSEITKASIKDRYEAYKVAKETGFISLNEIRAKENMNNIEGLDVIPMGLADVLYNIKSGEYFVPNTGQIKTDEQAESVKSEGGDPVESNDQNGLGRGGRVRKRNRTRVESTT